MIDEQRMRHLVDACNSIGLSEASILKVKSTAIELEQFERGRHRFKTAPARLKEVEKLRRHMNAIATMLPKLEPVNLRDLAHCLHDSGYPGEGLTYAPKHGGVFDWNTALQEALERAVEGCDAMTNRIGEQGAKGGRVQVLQWHAVYLDNLAFVLSANDRISTGRGAKFRHICELVFIAAGIESDPENAIRFLIERRKIDAKLLRQAARQAAQSDT